MDLVLQVLGVAEDATAALGPCLHVEVVVPADAEDALELLPPEPGVQAIDVVALTAETVAAVAAMDENVAAQYAELVVPAVGVADDDQFH